MPTPEEHYGKIMDHHLKILQDLQYSSGLFAASSKSVSTGYDKSWLRDNFYECLAFEVLGRNEVVVKTYKALLRIFLKHEAKIDWAIEQKPDARHKYIHARYHPETFDEFWEEWGNKQHDAVGAILFKLGMLEKRRVRILETPDEVRITQKLVQYLQSIEYWHDPDSGMWEEDEEIHASSVGACVAGLRAIRNVQGIQVPLSLIRKGQKTLKELLPRESEKKFVDLALLSLIYPYHVVTPEQRAEILEHVEYHLVRRHGVIRYKNDYYYNRNKDGYSEEAEWTFGLSWLSIIYRQMGEHAKAKQHLRKALKTVTADGEEPELYFSDSDQYNENTPLGWAESLLIVAISKMIEKGEEDEIQRHTQR
ncbi:MAG: glycoside hydrolase family 15 protein [Nanoarchaeota archaeon]